MLRTLERTFKHLLSLSLRLILGSRRISLTQNARFSRILVIRQHNQLGDMLCVVPLLRALRQRYPDASIVLMASPVNYDVMLNNRYIDRVMLYDKWEILGKGFAGFKYLLGFIRNLRAEKFDLLIVPSTVSTSFTSDLFAYLSGAQTRIGAGSMNGVENPSGFFFNVPVELDWRATPDRHQSLRNFDVAAPLMLERADGNIEITLHGHELEMANALKQMKLSQDMKVVSYHPGAGKLPNRWDPAFFAATANELGRDSLTLITSGPLDKEPVSEMVRRLHVLFEIIDEKPIREVAAILSATDLVIANDTGIMHVAAAVGTPVLSLFGPTDPEQWAPIGPGNRYRYLRGKDGKINSISVEEVLKNAREMLAETYQVEFPRTNA